MELEQTIHQTVDIIVIGTGAAASVAAIEANNRGNDVLMIEKAATYGGTTRVSAGGIWIPNHRFLRQQGIEDPKRDCLKFMARPSFPETFNEHEPRWGLSQTDYDLLEAFYDNGDKMIDALMDQAGLRLAGGEIQTGRSNYYHFPEDRVPRGRGLKCVNSDGSPGRGHDLTRQFEMAVKVRRIPVFFNTKAHTILQNTIGETVGIEASGPSRAGSLSIRARKGVIFGTGGFAHNSTLKRKFLSQPTFGSCAVKESEGDFIAMARAVGADTEGPAQGWWAEVVLEEALAGPITNDVWVPPGDSMVLVNRLGQRVVSEKLPYHVRTPIHFQWDPVKGEYTNLLLFMVYDQRTADMFNQATAVSYPLLTTDADYVIKGATLEELTRILEERLATISRVPSAPRIQLAPDFTRCLGETIEKFNRYARGGTDPEFHRGEIPVELDVNFTQGGINAGNSFPNPTMHPLADHGPYYAIILAAGLLDTHGGPRINARAQVLDCWGKPIPGLYGAGNCVTGPAGKAYWGAGATLGIAMTFGYIAAKNASMEPQRKTNPR